MYMSTTCMPDAHGGQKKASDPLELKLQMVLNHLAGTGN